MGPAGDAVVRGELMEGETGHFLWTSLVARACSQHGGPGLLGFLTGDWPAPERASRELRGSCMVPGDPALVVNV